jgi:2-phosphosulfolactate phosphatase
MPMSTTSLEVLFTPADFETLKKQKLSEAVCVVFDVLRATSSMVTALANGAKAIVPVAEISEAVALRRRDPKILLAGERNGVRIPASLSGGIDFDLGNSPREFVGAKVRGRTIAMTTTNGTRALRACAGARLVLVCSFLNLKATATFITHRKASRLILICSGTFEQTAYEDILGAGALCNLLWSRYRGGAVADSAVVARWLFRLERKTLLEAIGGSRNGKRLLSKPDLKDDVRFCARLNAFPLVVEMDKQGRVKRRRGQ